MPTTTPHDDSAYERMAISGSSFEEIWFREIKRRTNGPPLFAEMDALYQQNKERYHEDLSEDEIYYSASVMSVLAGIPRNGLSHEKPLKHKASPFSRSRQIVLCPENPPPRHLTLEEVLCHPAIPQGGVAWSLIPYSQGPFRVSILYYHPSFPRVEEGRLSDSLPVRWDKEGNPITSPPSDNGSA